MKRVTSRASVSLALIAIVLWGIWRWAAVEESGAIVDVVPRSGGSTTDSANLDKDVGDRVKARSEARKLELRLHRFPDDAALSVVNVEVATVPAGSENWAVTDDEGSLRVELPAGAEVLVLRAAGFESRELALLHLDESVPVALTPSSGLFGRVVDAEGQHVSGVEVALTVRRRTSRRLDYATRANPKVWIYENASATTSVRTNAGGYYYLPCETRNPGAPLRVVARSEEQGSASRDVAVPRAPELLEDLTLSPPRVLVVKVVDEAGAPLAGVEVSAAEPWWYAKEPTNAEGICRIVEPTLPAFIDATLVGWRRKETKIGGSLVAPGTRVMPSDSAVEIVLAQKAGVGVRLVDGHTRLPVRDVSAGGRVELFRDGGKVGVSYFQCDERGEGWIDFTDGQGRPLALLPDRVRVQHSVTGYRSMEPEFELQDAQPLQKLEVVLEPDPKFVCIRGQVLRNGQPVPGFQLGLHSKRRSAPSKGHGYERGYCDDEGRFALRFEAREDAVIVVHPHWKRWDEFGFLGPLSIEEATSKEHVLELRPSVRVSVILRNVVRSDRYTYHVALIDDDLLMPTTINGAPLAVETDGEAHTTMLLPSDRRASVTIGYLGGDAVRTNASPPVIYDPSRRFEPLVFDVESLYGRVSGRVVGFTPDELTHVGVGFRQSGDSDATIVPVDALGSFSFPSVALGAGRLVLFYEETGLETQVLAMTHVEVEGVVEGLVLSRDPESLPAGEPRDH